jgi:phosphoribosylanthranilate isomerase
MIVKICGIKTLEDARAAIDAGADMLGFNFYPPSPRYLHPGVCRQLVAALRCTDARVPVLVGVFVNLPAAQIADILASCELDLAQLHGDEPPNDLAALGGRAFKAIRPGTGSEAADQVRTYRSASPQAPEILLDASAPGLYGGSGQTANWAAAAGLAAETRLLLAGGLNPENVAEAVATVRPWGVDVASGVETSPGVKDSTKMKRFVDGARTAEATYQGSSGFGPIRPIRAALSQ